MLTLDLRCSMSLDHLRALGWLRWGFFSRPSPSEHHILPRPVLWPSPKYTTPPNCRGDKLALMCCFTRVQSKYHEGGRRGRSEKLPKADRKHRGRMFRTRNSPQLLPPARPRLLKFPDLFEVAQSVEGQAFHTSALGDFTPNPWCLPGKLLEGLRMLCDTHKCHRIYSLVWTALGHSE